MSMPTFPEENLDITQEQALNMLLGSIAMEEISLGHILGAEGEKLQYLMGTLHCQKGCGYPCANVQELLAANRSVGEVLEQIALNQFLLKAKLRQVLEAQERLNPAPWPPPPPWPPCPPKSPQPGPCPPQPPQPGPGRRGTCIYRPLAVGGSWACGSALAWAACGGEGGICWQGSSPSVIRLCHPGACLLSYSFRLRPGGCGNVVLELQGVGSPGNEVLITESRPICGDAPVHITGCTVLAPTDPRATLPPFRWVLCSPASAVVERGTLTVTLL